MKNWAIISMLLCISIAGYAQAGVPFINLPLMPDAIAPGGPQFTLTVNGTGFVSNSVVNWNNTPLATTLVSRGQLTATVPAANIATANTGWITVVNPAPGGGTSNTAFFTVTANVGNYIGFNLASSPVGAYPTSVAVGDFNGDGKLDLAVTNSGSNTVSVLLGDGAGNFTLTSSPVVGTQPYSVAVGDFNGDGKLDLAVVDCASDAVSILLGDGTGRFTVASSPATGHDPVSVAVGDFNGDGNLDLAVATCGGDECIQPGTVSILLGDGTGNFTLASSPAAGSFPWSVAVGDFNGDGKLDLAVANSRGDTVSILLGDGTGNFTLASSPAVGSTPRSILAADFNNDGNLDLAVTNTNSNTVSILLGDGTGNFTPASIPVVGAYPLSVAVGDFNGDGKLDLAVANDGSGTVSTLLGDGTGNFTLASSAAAGGTPWGLAVGDFNGDGKLDLAVADYLASTVSILLQGSPTVALSPSNLTFGTQLVDTRSKPQHLTLTNTGAETLVISQIASSSWDFHQTNNCPSNLPPNGQCTINVTFKPHTRDKHTGTITITNNAANSPQTVPLTGVGTVVGLSPSSLDFGDQPVNTTSPPQQVTLTNQGKDAVNIHNIHIGGPNYAAFAQTNNCGTSVPAGGSCAINVTFTPKHKGANSATLDVADDGGASPQTVPLSGTGTE